MREKELYHTRLRIPRDNHRDNHGDSPISAAEVIYSYHVVLHLHVVLYITRSWHWRRMYIAPVTIKATTPPYVQYQ